MIKLKCLACLGTGKTTLLERCLNIGLAGWLSWWFLTQELGNIPLMCVGGGFGVIAIWRIIDTLIAKGDSDD